MATIRASCADCGDVELPSSEIQVRVCSADEHGTYLFRCPGCQMVVVKPARSRTIELLVATGVPRQTWDLPLELIERVPAGPAIDHDDLIDFHERLADEGALWGELATLDEAGWRLPN